MSSASSIFPARRELLPALGLSQVGKHDLEAGPAMAVGSGTAKIQHHETAGTSTSLLHWLEPQDVCLLCSGMPGKLPYSQNFFLLLLPSRKSVLEKGGGNGAGGRRLGAAEGTREVMHILAYMRCREQQVKVGAAQKWGTPH